MTLYSRHASVKVRQKYGEKKMARGIFNIQSDLDYYDDIRLNHSKVST